MRLFICVDHDGVYLSGHSVILAEDERDAALLLNQALMDANLHPLEPKYTLRELPLERGAHVIWNGDY